MGGSEPDQRVAGLVGRERVCVVIDRLLERAESGESGSLVLRGDAGVGKTALLRYATSRAVGATVLSVTGIEAESDLDSPGFTASCGQSWGCSRDCLRPSAPRWQAVSV